MANAKATVEFKFSLPSKVIRVEPIFKETYFIPNKKHIASFLAPRATNNYQLVMKENGSYVEPLTKEELEFFENPDLSGLHYKAGDLSVYKVTDNYWDTFKISLGKLAMTLNLQNPLDYITYKVLLTNKDLICPSIELLNTKASYKYVIVDQEEALRIETNEADLEEKAWEIYGDIKNNPQRMIDIVKVMSSRTLTKDSATEFLRKNVLAEIKKDYKNFVKTINDPNFDTKLLIENGISTGVIQRKGAVYTDVMGDTLSTTGIRDAITYLNSPRNQEKRVNLENKINDII